ncbi:unnamed protein product [Fusarium fujikuroi]|nr:unnamed protein product [Fusarium fujikuroi]
MAATLTITRLKTHLGSTQAKIYEPGSPNYKEAEQCFIEKPVLTIGVVKPQNADEVALVLQFCIHNQIEFTIRGGGHDCAGRTLVDGAIVIDMRDINYVVISDDGRSARVGGGILSGNLARVLGEQGLATPTGTISTVGYTGWATLGGYGPLTSHYGLGVDQIIGAKIVNARGEIQDASEELLVGIRGGGGSLGIVVELTIKVYYIPKILSSTLIYESSDLEAALVLYNQYYEGLLTSGNLPTQLQLQPMISKQPGHSASLLVLATWHGEDIGEGHRWIKDLAGATACVMETTQEITLTEFLEANEKLVAWPSYGRVYTLNVKKLTNRLITILAKNSTNAPGGGMIFTYQSLLSTQDSEHKSVFGTRVSHHMLEICAVLPDKTHIEERIQWAIQVKADLETENDENILTSSYISFHSHEDTDFKKAYGQHYETLLALKRDYDGYNVFKHSIPSLPVEDKDKIIKG